MPSSATVTNILKAQETDGSKTLGLVMNGKPVTPAQYMARAEAPSPPAVSFAVPKTADTYMVVCLDLDAPFASFNVMSPILHWIQSDFKSSDGNALASTAPTIASYIPPAPPPGAGPHRYVFLLFTQPEGFNVADHAPADGKPLGIWARVRYDLDGWMRTVGLGEPIAVNYFTSN